jgi:antirestriction protein ArdC
MNEEARTKVKQAIDSAVSNLIENIDRGKSEALISFLEGMSKFHTYSFYNQCLIISQKPNASLVAGFNTWKDKGRHVKRGEKGIMILAPLIGKERKIEIDTDTWQEKEIETTSKLYGFKSVYVFDVSQTEGKEIATYKDKLQGDPMAFIPKIESLINDKGIELEYRELNSQFLNGWSEKGKIVVDSQKALPQQFSTLVHEFVHEMLHKDTATIDKTRRELEAESVSYIVCKYIGLETGTKHSDYIALYGGNKEMLLQSLEKVREVANEVISYLN